MKKGRSKQVVSPPPIPVPQPIPAPPPPQITAPPEKSNPAPAPAPAQTPAQTKAPRVKKEKKPVQVVAVVTPDGIEGTFTPEPRRPLIVNFPFNSSEVQFNENGAIHYDPSPPPNVQPYDQDGNVYFQVNTENSSEANQVGVEQEGWKIALTNAANEGSPPPAKEVEQKPSSDVPVPEKQQTPFPENFQRAQILACYSTEKGATFTPPSSTQICCYWCAQPFPNAPCFLPVKEESGMYSVYGNFCTPQCGLAYLLNEHLDSHVRWERMALLHRMYKSSRLYPSPPREALVQFGGPYTYEKYRQVISDGKTRIDIQTPPMISILGTLDTKPIDFYDSSLQNTFTSGFSLDRFKAWSEQGGALRLKRTKPLKDKDSTLDACIQISIKRGGEAT